MQIPEIPPRARAHPWGEARGSGARGGLGLGRTSPCWVPVPASRWAQRDRGGGTVRLRPPCTPLFFLLFQGQLVSIPFSRRLLIKELGKKRGFGSLLPCCKLGEGTHGDALPSHPKSNRGGDDRIAEPGQQHIGVSQGEDRVPVAFPSCRRWM